MSPRLFPLALRDRDLIPAEDLAISVASPSAQYGHGLFEGVMAYPAQGGGLNVVALREHLERLFRSARELFPRTLVPVTPDQALDGICRMLKENGVAEQAYVRPSLLVPRAADIHLAPFCGPDVFVFSAYAQSCSGFRKQGLNCVVSPFRKPNAAAARHKLSGLYAYLNMAIDTAVAAGFDECLLLDQDGLVAEGTFQNILVQWRGLLLTPRTEGRPILPSITMLVARRLLESAPGGPQFVQPADVTPTMLAEASAVALVGTASEMNFVRSLTFDGEKWLIGAGGGTPLIRWLIGQYGSFVRGEIGHEDLLVHV
jgi:branched-chain amino acid aminotransferase